MKGHCGILPYSENIMDTLRVKWLFTNSIFLTRNMKWGHNSICLFSRTNSEKSAGSRFGLISKQYSNKHRIKLRHNSWTKNFSFSHWFEFYRHWPETTDFFCKLINAGQKLNSRMKKSSDLLSTINDGHFTTNNVQCHNIHKLWMSNFHIDTRIRNLCSLKPDIPWQGLRGSLNYIQKGSWFHKWLVYTSEVKWV